MARVIVFDVKILSFEVVILQQMQIQVDWSGCDGYDQIIEGKRDERNR